jgi:hypothetical protein
MTTCDVEAKNNKRNLETYMSKQLELFAIGKINLSSDARTYFGFAEQLEKTYKCSQSTSDSILQKLVGSRDIAKYILRAYERFGLNFLIGSWENFNEKLRQAGYKGGSKSEAWQNDDWFYKIVILQHLEPYSEGRKNLSGNIEDRQWFREGVAYWAHAEKADMVLQKLIGTYDIARYILKAFKKFGTGLFSQTRENFNKSLVESGCPAPLVYTFRANELELLKAVDEYSRVFRKNLQPSNKIIAKSNFENALIRTGCSETLAHAAVEGIARTDGILKHLRRKPSDVEIKEYEDEQKYFLQKLKTAGWPEDLANGILALALGNKDLNTVKFELGLTKVPWGKKKPEDYYITRRGMADMEN